MSVHSFDYHRAALSAAHNFQRNVRDTVRTLGEVLLDPHLSPDGRAVKVAPLRAAIAERAATARHAIAEAVRKAEARAAEHQPATLRRRAAIARPGTVAEFAALFATITRAEDLEEFAGDLQPADGRPANLAAAYALVHRAKEISARAVPDDPETFARAVAVVESVDAWADAERRDVVDDVILAQHAAALLERAVSLAEGQSTDPGALWRIAFNGGPSDLAIAEAFKRRDESPAVIDPTVTLSPEAEAALAAIPAPRPVAVAA